MLLPEQINFIEKYWDVFPYQLDYVAIRVLENHQFKRGHDFIIKLDDDLLYGEYYIDNREGFIVPVKEDIGHFLNKPDCYHPASNEMFENIMRLNTTYKNEETKEKIKIKKEQYATEVFKEVDNYGIIHLIAPSGREKFQIPLKNNLQYIFGVKDNINQSTDFNHICKLINLGLRVSINNNTAAFRYAGNLREYKINEKLINDFIKQCKWNENLTIELNKKEASPKELPKL